MKVIKLVLVSGIILYALFASLASANDAGGSFQRGPDMNQARMYHNKILLPEGKVVVLGGHGTNFVSLSSAEIWDPSTNTFTPLSMNYPHDGGGLAKLKDGRYLIAGGAKDLGVAPGYDTAEIYNPSDNTFTPTGQMNYARCNTKAATLESGKVLVVGGWYDQNSPKYGELFDPSTNTFSATGALNTQRSNPLVIPTTDGRAVVIGGVPPYGGSGIESIELYDPSTNSFSVLQETLITSDTGWKVDGASYLSPIDDYKLSDGKYILTAYKNVNTKTQFALFTFDPDTKAFTKLPVALPDTDTVSSIFPPVVDKSNNKVYLLAIVKTTQAIPSALRLYTVDLTNMTINNPTGSYTLNPPYLAGGVVSVLLNDGRIFVSGGTTSDDYYYNFNPVKYTLFITPGASAPQPIKDALFEDFEDGVLDSRISFLIESGDFSSQPGIKDVTAFGSKKAFGFGKSNCGASCFSNYTSSLIIDLESPTYVSKISFKEMELFGNWGSGGKIYIDNEPIPSSTCNDISDPACHDFGRQPYNDGNADTNFRSRTFWIGKTVKIIKLHVWDITSSSEIFIDDLKIEFGEDSSGIVSLWKGEGDAKDSIGTNHGVEKNGATYAPGIFGWAFSFDGIDDYVEIPDSSSLDVTTQFTLAAWVYPKGYKGGYPDMGVITKHAEGAGSYNGYLIGLHRNGENWQVLCQFNAQGESWPTNEIFGGVVTDNTWHHIACTYDNSELRVYVNGSLAGSVSVGPKNVANSSSPVRIGNDLGLSPFNGYIDEAAIFNRALTPQEIASLYNEKKLTLALSQQWNFVSFMKLPSEATIENVLGTDNLSKVKIIWSFDNENKKWLKWRPNGGAQNKITSFEFGKGYWIYMDESVTIDMTGWIEPLNRTVPLYPGWNLVGWIGESNKSVSDALNSLSGNWSVLWTWKNNNWKVKHESLTGLPYENIESFENNRAYWIRVKNGTQWQQ